MSLEIISNWSLEQPPKHSLTVPELLRSQDNADRRVGMIIDLANHECLYSEDLPETLEYTHIQLVAKVLPPPEAINAVAEAAEEFWARRPNDFIAIHCAYGFNRTGFVVCSYLCQECGMTVPEALESFAQARPPGVKHGKFVDELYARYGINDCTNDDCTNINTTGEESSQISLATLGIPPITTTPAAVEEEEEEDGVPPASPSNVAFPRSGLLSNILRKGSNTSASGGGKSLSSSSTPVRRSGSFSRRSIDGGGGGGYGAWKEERANSLNTASEDGTTSSVGASIGSPSINSLKNFLPPLSTSSAVSSAHGSLIPPPGGGGGGSGYLPPLSLNDNQQLVGEEEETLEPERTSGQWSEMAQQVEGKSLMRRETSLGLAKALHEDFGVHDSTPSRHGVPSPLMKKLNAEEAGIARKSSSEPDVQDQLERLTLEYTPPPAHRSSNNVPSSTPPSATSVQLQQQQQQQHAWSQGFPTTATTAAAGANKGHTSSSINNIAAPGAEPYIPRNMSFESDCHSLGFNAREAITQLRTQQQAGGGSFNNTGASFNRQYSVASDLDTTLWETSEDEGADGSAEKSKAPVSRRQIQPPVQQRDCSLM